MTTDVTLPALDGHDPLGFLAALGVLHVINGRTGNARLSFSEHHGAAVLTSPLQDTNAIAAVLTEAAQSIPQGCVLEGTGPGFPLRKTGNERDPMKVLREQYREKLHASAARTGSPAALEWLAALVTDLGINDKKEQLADLTPFTAPSGQQSLWTFFEKSLVAIRSNPRYLTEALTAWRRIDNFSGEYLDHRVLNSAADHPSGKSTEAGVPGATWLAIQALLIFRLTGNGMAARSTLWHQGNGNGRRPVMIWPLWSQPLDEHAVRVLLEHPLLRPIHRKAGQPGQPAVDRTRLAPLSVFDVCGAERLTIPGRKSKGVLVPLRILP